MSSRTQWHQDILGPHWVARTIPLGEDQEGPLDATLVRSAETPRSARAVLYIHGFVDYFFQEHEAGFFAELGYDFYAIDLRKHGRSLHRGQTANYVENLADYRTELDRAAQIIAHEGHEELVVLGHSTGGLTASFWVNARARQDGEINKDLGLRISALILNSPWFDLNKPWLLRTIGTKAVAGLARIAPKTQVGSLGPHYGRAMHASTGGSWDYNLEWKPLDGFPVRAGWFTAIRRAQQQLRKGLNISVPVLMLTSERSGNAEKWHEDILTTDSVLNVKHMWDIAPKIAHNLTIVPIAGGGHDLALSPDPARTEYFDAIRTWLVAQD